MDRIDMAVALVEQRLAALVEQRHCYTAHQRRRIGLRASVRAAASAVRVERTRAFRAQMS